jgi:hypothetical protein
MSVRTRSLLDRFRKLILPIVLIADDSASSIQLILQLINIRHLTEAAELARVIYSEIKPNIENVAPQPSQFDQLNGVPFWTRQLIMRAADEAARSKKHPMTKAHDDLQEVIDLIKRKSKSSKFKNANDEIDVRVREFPQIVRNFYEIVDWSLPIH